MTIGKYFSQVQLRIGQLPTNITDSNIYQAFVDVYNSLDTIVQNINRQADSRVQSYGDGVATIVLGDEGGTIFVNATSNDVDVELPDPQGRSGISFTIKQIAGAYTTTVSCTTSDVETSASGVVIGLLDSITVMCDGTEWWTVSTK